MNRKKKVGFYQLVRIFCELPAKIYLETLDFSEVWRCRGRNGISPKKDIDTFSEGFLSDDDDL